MTKTHDPPARKAARAALNRVNESGDDKRKKLIDMTPDELDATVDRAMSTHERTPVPLGSLPQSIPVDLIDSSLHNARKTFNQQSLDELAADIQAHGLIQPVLVRPVANGRYELMAGERRLRAIRQLMHEKDYPQSLKAVPAIVRGEPDISARVLGLVENLQRENLNPMEESLGIRDAVRLGNWSVDQAAEKLHKPRGHIYVAMKLADLPKAGADALRDGTLSRSHGEILARIPRGKVQDEAVEFALNGPHWDKGPVSVKQLRDWVSENACRQLKGAPFSLKLADLVPAAGACASCPKMTGNNPDAFPGSRGDMCTDPACYASKVAANGVKMIREHDLAGGRVATPAQTKQVFAYGNNSVNTSAFVDLDDLCWADGKNRKWSAILGGEKEQALLAVAPSGKPVMVMEKEKARAIAKKNGVKFSASGDSATQGAADKKRKKDRAARRNAATHALRELLGMAEKEGKSSDKLMRCAAILAICVLKGKPADVIARRRKIAFKTKGYGRSDADYRLVDVAAKADAWDAFALLLECLFDSALPYYVDDWFDAPKFIDAMDAAGIDMKEMKKRAAVATYPGETDDDEEPADEDFDENQDGPSGQYQGAKAASAAKKPGKAPPPQPQPKKAAVSHEPG